MTWGGVGGGGRLKDHELPGTSFDKDGDETIGCLLGTVARGSGYGAAGLLGIIGIRGADIDIFGVDFGLLSSFSSLSPFLRRRLPQGPQHKHQTKTPTEDRKPTPPAMLATHSSIRPVSTPAGGGRESPKGGLGKFDVEFGGPGA